MTKFPVDLDVYDRPENLFYVTVDPLYGTVASFGTMCPISARYAKEQNPNYHFFVDPISIEEVQVNADRSVHRRTPMNIQAPSSATVGDTVSVSGIPPGTLVTFDGKELGVMDDSGVLEFEAKSVGPHRFDFRASDYVPMEITIEVRS